MKIFKPFQSIVVFHVETSHFLSGANQMTGFYVECNTEVKWVKGRHCYIRNNNNKVDSIETGCVIIAHLLP